MGEAGTGFSKVNPYAVHAEIGNLCWHYQTFNTPSAHTNICACVQLCSQVTDEVALAVDDLEVQEDEISIASSDEAEHNLIEQDQTFDKPTANSSQLHTALKERKQPACSPPSGFAASMHALML